MTIYYTSDWHLTFSEESPDAQLLENINKKVKETDTLYILGDLCIYPQDNYALLRDYLKQIKCRNIRVLCGNHDDWSILGTLAKSGAIQQCMFQAIIQDEAFKCQTHLFISHYPTLDHRQRMNIHGHSHGTLPNTCPGYFDVAVELWNYEPVSLEEILSRFHGDHPNPYIGYIDALKEFVNKGGYNV